MASNSNIIKGHNGDKVQISRSLQSIWTYNADWDFLDQLWGCGKAEDASNENLYYQQIHWFAQSSW